MNVAVIFAGGQGNRLHNYSRPKQFLEYRGKPIVIYTIEIFQHIAEIDGIVVACLEDWIPYLRTQVKKYRLTKVVEIVPGGKRLHPSAVFVCGIIMCTISQLKVLDTSVHIVLSATRVVRNQCLSHILRYCLIHAAKMRISECRARSTFGRLFPEGLKKLV